MKKLLSSLINKEGLHGLNTRLSWLPDLDHLDAISGINLSAKNITSIVNDHALSVAEKIHLLLLIEDANHASLQQQITSFVKLDNLKTDITHHIVDVNYAYYRMAFLSYTKLIDLSFNKLPEQQPQPAIKLIVLARAISTAINMLKWRYFDRAGAPANLWSQINGLYQYAIEHQLLNTAIKPYQDSISTSVNSLFLQLWMLGNLNFSGLLKPQIETVAELLSLSMHEVKIDSIWQPKYTFYIELTKDQPAKRLRKVIPTSAALFWHLDVFEADMKQILFQAKSQQMPTCKGQPLKNSHSIEATLTYLQKEWTRNDYIRQRRKEIRHDIIRSASVSVGFQSVCELLQQLNLNHAPVKSLLDGNLAKRPVQTRVVNQGNTNTLMVGKEKWNILNESTLGLGTFVTQDSGALIKPNRLVAILTARTQSGPAIGVIRNNKQMSGAKLKIGIELLTENPQLAILKRFEVKKDRDVRAQHLANDDEHINTEFFGIHIPYLNTLNRSCSLILPKIEFLPNTFYEIHFKNKREIVKFDVISEQGDDWVSVTFPEELK
ncbi:MAG: hypothetical protein B7X95_06980 [Methylophilaceae bacterium 17-44-8]|nr:MAG: hypothetical protein B7Y48_04255 [Methylophilales bacterium 28-44-11]OZA05312.1 MAG: hypothetical protein B7X95_06980 [Methylophilaceae bacterium 17-44-8]